MLHPVKRMVLSIWEKAKRDMALNLSELAVCTGYSRSELTEMRHEGLPLFHGKTTVSDFKRWVRRQTTGRGKACPTEPEGLSPQQAADKLYEP